MPHHTSLFIYLHLRSGFYSHDFIGEFTTSYKELCRGQGQSNVYEVRGENGRYRYHPLCLLSRGFYSKSRVAVTPEEFSRLGLRGGIELTERGCESLINDVLMHQKQACSENILCGFKSRSVTFDSGGLTSLTFRERTPFLTCIRIYLKSGIVLPNGEGRVFMVGNQMGTEVSGSFFL